MENPANSLAVTDKGAALLAAIEAGLIPETDDGHDIEAFEEFWEIYSEKSLRNFEKRLDHANEAIKNLIKMLNDEREQRANDRADHRITQGRFFLATLVGMLLGSFLTALL